MKVRVAFAVGALLASSYGLVHAAERLAVSVVKTSTTELPKDGIGGEAGAMIDKGPIVVIGITYKPEKGGEASLYTRTDDSCPVQGEKHWAVLKGGSPWKGEHVVPKGQFLCVTHNHNKGTAILTWDVRGADGGS